MMASSDALAGQLPDGYPFAQGAKPQLQSGLRPAQFASAVHKHTFPYTSISMHTTVQVQGSLCETTSWNDHACILCSTSVYQARRDRKRPTYSYYMDSA